MKCFCDVLWYIKVVKHFLTGLYELRSDMYIVIYIFHSYFTASTLNPGFAMYLWQKHFVNIVRKGENEPTTIFQLFHYVYYPI